MEEALEPAHELGQHHAELGCRDAGRVGERHLAELGEELVAHEVLELLERAVVQGRESVPDGLARLAAAELVEHPPDGGGDPERPGGVAHGRIGVGCGGGIGGGRVGV